MFLQATVTGGGLEIFTDVKCHLVLGAGVVVAAFSMSGHQSLQWNDTCEWPTACEWLDACEWPNACEWCAPCEWSCTCKGPTACALNFQIMAPPRAFKPRLLQDPTVKFKAKFFKSKITSIGLCVRPLIMLCDIKQGNSFVCRFVQLDEKSCYPPNCFNEDVECSTSDSSKVGA
uniref:Uncharacterized protein n=1 Tax=Cannabis sativa TaxID=3483 RepID=A0A803QFT2_CANSA